MKILFLDIDGVLNSEKSLLSYRAANPKGSLPIQEPESWIPEAVTQLKRIISETGCELVISSCWRTTLDKLEIAFNYWGLPEWFSITPESPSGYRGEEIDLWIKGKSTIESFAIVDDVTNDIHQKENLVETPMGS